MLVGQGNNVAADKAEPSRIQPIPTLETTTRRLRWLVDRDARRDFDRDTDYWNSLIASIDTFADERGAKIQSVLEERQRRSRGLYMSSLYRQTYLLNRGSLTFEPITHSPAGLFRLPSSSKGLPIAGRAAVIIHAIVSEWLAHREDCPRNHGDAPACPTGECRFLGSYRRKGEPLDCVVDTPKSTHVALICRGRLGFLEVLDGDQGHEVRELSAAIKQFLDQLERFTTSLPLIFTTMPKENALVMAGSLDRQPATKETLARLHSALFVIEIDPDPEIDSAYSRLMHASYFGNGCNRFFGKSNVWVNMSDKIGFTGDHALVDGFAATGFLNRVMDKLSLQTISDANPGSDDQSPRLLSSITRDTGNGHSTSARCKQALDTYRRASRSYSICSVELPPCAYRGGGRFLMLPIIAQLAYYQIHGRMADTYLPVSLGHYSFGRVAGVRCCDVDLLALGRMLRNGSTWGVDRLLDSALSRWRWLVAWSRHDGGIERHLAALAMLSTELGIDVPLLGHPYILARSAYPEITTSVLPGSEHLLGFCFPPSDGNWALATTILDDRTTVTLLTKSADGRCIADGLSQTAEALNQALSAAA